MQNGVWLNLHYEIIFSLKILKVRQPFSISEHLFKTHQIQITDSKQKMIKEKQREIIFNFKVALDWPYSGMRINGIASRFLFLGKYGNSSTSESAIKAEKQATFDRICI